MNQLRESEGVTADALVRRERQHLVLVRAVAFTEGQAVEAEGPAMIEEIALPLAGNTTADYVEVLDPRSHRLFGVRAAGTGKKTYLFLTEPDNRDQLTLVRNVLDGREDALGDKYAQIIET